MIKNLSRMSQWLLLSLVFYAAALLLSSMHIIPGDLGLWPRVQTVFWKCGHLNLSAFLGYWIARSRLGRLTPTSTPTDRLAHALIIVGTMWAYGQAL